MCQGACEFTDHVECGFCSRCHEHAFSYYTCLACEDPADDSPCSAQSDGTHEPDVTSDALTSCCGASILSYDYDPS